MGAITTAQLTRACTGLGLDPAFGALHATTPGRPSLAWDCYELLRARVEAALFGFLAVRGLKVAEFEHVREPRAHVSMREPLRREIAGLAVKTVPFGAC